MLANGAPNLDDLRGFMLFTQGRLTHAQALLADREATLQDLTRAQRRTKEGVQFSAWVEATRTAVQSIERTLASCRFQLGEGPLPDGCNAVRHGLLCSLAFGHEGMHEAFNESLLERWE